MHVLIATDGSDDAVVAARHALSLLAPPDAITVLCVVEVPAEATAGQESGFAGGMEEPAAIDAAWDAVRAEALGMLDRTVEALSTTVAVEPLIEAGAPGPTVCRIAEDRAADIVVIGSRGRGAIRRALMGSVSTYVVNHAPCPVMVIRASQAPA